MVPCVSCFVYALGAAEEDPSHMLGFRCYSLWQGAAKNCCACSKPCSGRGYICDPLTGELRRLWLSFAAERDELGLAGLKVYLDKFNDIEAVARKLTTEAVISGGPRGGPLLSVVALNWTFTQVNPFTLDDWMSGPSGGNRLPPTIPPATQPIKQLPKTPQGKKRNPSPTEVNSGSKRQRSGAVPSAKSSVVTRNTRAESPSPTPAVSSLFGVNPSAADRTRVFTSMEARLGLDPNRPRGSSGVTLARFSALEKEFAEFRAETQKKQAETDRTVLEMSLQIEFLVAVIKRDHAE
jgi:hypothetical protein